MFRPRNYLADWPMPQLKFDSNPELLVFSFCFLVLCDRANYKEFKRKNH